MRDHFLVRQLGETVEIYDAGVGLLRQVADVGKLLLRKPRGAQRFRLDFQNRFWRERPSFALGRDDKASKDRARGLAAQLLIDDRADETVEVRLPVLDAAGANLLDYRRQNRVRQFEMLNCLAHGNDAGLRGIYDGIESMKPPLLAASLALLTALPALPQDDVIKVDVDVVNVLFNVRTKKNGLAGGLTKDDFEIFEDGKKQDIKFFVKETNLPLTIGMLVDVSMSQEFLIEQEKQSALQFFQRVLRKEDLAFLISFGPEAELLQDFTNSVKLLRAGLDQLRPRGSPGAYSPTGSPVPTAGTPRGTILYDAVYLAAVDQLKSQVGRKVVILVTDGMDQGSRYTRDKAIEGAQKSDAIIYSIFHADYRRNGYFYRPNPSELTRMSTETGGRMFEAGRTDLSTIFKEIEEDVRSQYAIGFTPTNANKDGSFRKLEIRPKNKELKVHARKGYYAVKPEN